jgi:predicted O-methyltransferase YrrM
MNLDTLTPVHSQVGYGTLGRGGDLGYEGKRVTVRHRGYQSALSTHPPARLLYRLDAHYRTFSCGVALNDDVPNGQSYADFLVLADGRQVAAAPFVRAGEGGREITANIAGARMLELVVNTGRWEYCHAVWLDPRLDAAADAAEQRTFVDALERAEITLPATPPRTRLCVATVGSGGHYATMLDDMLGSLVANGGCHDALLVVFSVGDDDACARVAAKYRATVIPCRPRARANPTAKAILYSAARVIDADYFICLDADILILDDLTPIVTALDAMPDGTVFACREGNGRGYTDLAHILTTAYGGSVADVGRLLGEDNGEAHYSLVVNDGLFAGSRTAMLALDGAIRAMNHAAEWVDARTDIGWRNQFIFNLALAKLQNGAELDPTYNVQLHTQNIELRAEGSRVRASWHARNARVLHFSGAGRSKHPEWRGLFARASEALVGAPSGDGYADFLSAVRAWVGRRGMAALAWSFYGTSDARNGRVRDLTTMPLFALLHYLVRSNGCVRIVESGTGRGVSTACMAAAVAHRSGGRVVTFDPHTLPERADLWGALPAPMRACIDQRAGDGVEGMHALFAAGERFDAALLDSIHTEAQVLTEFEIACQLVCPGGLILCHDATLAGATVDVALKKIEAMGYGVTRLWTAECGIPEDDHLGLAVIENRRREAV